MAPAVSDGVWRRSTPDAVDRDLATLWREIADRGPVARAVMSNLVVFRCGGTSAVADDLLRDVVSRHPSRTIVVEHDRGAHEPGRLVDAQVGVSVFGPPTAQYGVEWVVLRSTCAEASWPSLVRRFVHGDVPTSIWWPEDLAAARALAPIVATGRQLLYDSRHWRDVQGAIKILAPLLREGRVDLVDLNWRRLAPLRLALAQSGPLGSLAAVQTSIAHRRNEQALAALLGGWVAARLNWAVDQSPAISESDLAGDALRLELGEGDRRLVARLNDRRVEIERQGTTPLVVASPRRAAAESVAVELRSLATDRGLRDTLTALSDRLVS